MAISGEIGLADHTAASSYPAQLKQLIDDGRFTPQQIYNADETGAY